MKKVLSLLIAVLLVVGMAPVTFAAVDVGSLKLGLSQGGVFVTDKATVSPHPSYYYDYNSYSVKLFIRDMSTGNYLTQTDVIDNKLDYRLNTMEGKGALGSHALKYDMQTRNAFVEVRFANPYVRVSALDFKYKVVLYADRVEISEIELNGRYQNYQIDVAAGEKGPIDLTRGNSYVYSTGYCPDIKLQLQHDVVVTTTMFENHKRFAHVTRDVKEADLPIVSQYPDIESIFYISHVGLINSNSSVKINGISEMMYVYINKNGSLQYAGTTDEAIRILDNDYTKLFVSYKPLNLPTPTPTPTDTSSSSGSGGGGGGGAPAILRSANVDSSGAVSQTKILSELNSALKSDADSAILRTRNADKISRETLKKLADAAKKAGKPALLYADTLRSDNRTIQGRLYVEPDKLGDLKADLKLGVYTDSAKTKKTKDRFEKSFDNKVAVIRCSQNGSFGARLKLSALVDLKDLDAEKLMFYSYDRETGQYTLIENPQYKIDDKGYLSFYTETGGDIIITDRPLKKK